MFESCLKDKQTVYFYKFLLASKSSDGIMPLARKETCSVASYVSALRNNCLGGEIGRRSGFKIHRGKTRAGSSPAPGTKLISSTVPYAPKALYSIGFM